MGLKYRNKAIKIDEFWPKNRPKRPKSAEKLADTDPSNRARGHITARAVLSAEKLPSPSRLLRHTFVESP